MCSLATKASWSDRRSTFLRLGRFMPFSLSTGRVGIAVGSPYEIAYIEILGERAASMKQGVQSSSFSKI